MDCAVAGGWKTFCRDSVTHCCAGEVRCRHEGGETPVQGWLARMKALKSRKSVNAVLDGITAAHKGEAFVTV